MTIRLIMPMKNSWGNNVFLDMRGGYRGSIEVEFVDKNDKHMGGFSLIYLSDMGLLLFDSIGSCGVDINYMDLDNSSRLKIVGVDIV